MQESHILFLANVFSCICIILHCLVAHVDKSLAVDKSDCKNCGLAFVMVLPIAVYFIHNGVINVIGNGPKKDKAKLIFFLSKSNVPLELKYVMSRENKVPPK